MLRLHTFLKAVVATAALFSVASLWCGHTQLVLSGNETKIDLNSGTPKVIVPKKPDSISILDFSSFPPKVQNLMEVPNSVIGPPSNIAVTPNHKLALVANSIRIDPQNPNGWGPASNVWLIDLTTSPARLIGSVVTGAQPSGLSISADGRLALVANRAEGTISVLAIHGTKVRPVQKVQVCAATDNLSDVAISPDGRRAIASVQQGGYLALLRIEGEHVILSPRRLSVYGQPYRVVITPDGELALTAGAGHGNGLDHDAISVIDLTSHPIRTIDYVAIGTGPESIQASPDGHLLAAVVMNGSNLPPGDPNRSAHGGLLLLKRAGKTYRLIEELPVGRIPEGVAFTSDGHYLLVGCHEDRQIWIFAISHDHLRDTGKRVPVPGMPSSLRAAP